MKRTNRKLNNQTNKRNKTNRQREIKQNKAKRKIGKIGTKEQTNTITKPNIGK